jgi:hypothetical protein
MLVILFEESGTHKATNKRAPLQGRQEHECPVIQQTSQQTVTLGTNDDNIVDHVVSPSQKTKQIPVPSAYFVFVFVTVSKRYLHVPQNLISFAARQLFSLRVCAAVVCMCCCCCCLRTLQRELGCVIDDRYRRAQGE